MPCSHTIAWKENSLTGEKIIWDFFVGWLFFRLFSVVVKGIVMMCNMISYATELLLNAWNLSSTEYIVPNTATSYVNLDCSHTTHINILLPTVNH